MQLKSLKGTVSRDIFNLLFYQLSLSGPIRGTLWGFQILTNFRGVAYTDESLVRPSKPAHAFKRTISPKADCGCKVLVTGKRFLF